MQDKNLKPQFNEKSAPPVFRSERCQYREFGIYADGQSFAAKHPELAAAVAAQDAATLLDKSNPLYPALSTALRELPEYKAFLKTTSAKDFFFAAFGQSYNRRDNPERSGPGRKTSRNSSSTG
jgi:hypothetical protein